MNSVYSHFDTNPIKEYETLDLEQKLLTGVNIQFSYYPIISREIQRKSGMIYSIYRGNTTQPNVILNDKNYFPTYYQTSELCIYGNPLHEGSHSAELVVKHVPVSSSVDPLYVCFFLHRKAPPSPPSSSSSSSSSPPSSPPFPSPPPPMEPFESPAGQLKLIIETKDTVEIDLSSFLRPYQVFINETQNPDLPVSWKLYKSTIRENGKSCFVVLIENPIWIDSLTFDKIPSNKKAVSPFITYNDTIFANNVNEMTNKDPLNYKEGFKQVNATDTYALENNSNNQMVCEVIDDGINKNQETNYYQVLVDGTTNKSQQKMDTLLMGLYVALGSGIVAASMVFTPTFFDSLFQLKFINTAFGDKPKLFLGLLLTFILAVGGSFIGYGFYKTPINTSYVIIGVLIGIYALLASVGTLSLSHKIKQNQESVPST